MLSVAAWVSGPKFRKLSQEHTKKEETENQTDRWGKKEREGEKGRREREGEMEGKRERGGEGGTKGGRKELTHLELI